MSRKGIDTPPPGSNLLADFQTFCQSPAFITALQQNPLAAQMFQPLASTPSVPSLPENDYTINVRCISQHLSKSFSDTILMFPMFNQLGNTIPLIPNFLVILIQFISHHGFLLLL